jgi:hypothetical protein
MNRSDYTSARRGTSAHSFFLLVFSARVFPEHLMTSPFDPSLLLPRRGILGATAGMAAASAVAARAADSPRDAVAPAPRYPFLKSLNIWAMPYPRR